MGLAACALVFAAGCGGDGGEPKPKPPTAAEIEAAHDRWRERVDAVCFEVNGSIGRRGSPVEVDATGWTVAEAVEDVREGIRKVLAVPLAGAGDSQPAAFVRELKAFDAELAKLPGGGEDMEAAALVRAADRFRPRLRELEVRAGSAGLTDCLTHAEHEMVPDAVRRPIFLERLDRHDERFVKRLPIFDEPAATWQELAERMERLGGRLDGLVQDVATFDPPSDAKKAAGSYRTWARRLLRAVRRYEAFARSGGSTSNAVFRRYARAFSRAWRETGGAHGRMHADAGIPPSWADEAVTGAQES